MRSPTSTPVPAPPRPLTELGLGAAWLVGVAGALQLVERLIGSAALAAPIAGAVLVDVAASRAGARWDARGPVAWQDAARRVARGAALAVVIGAAVTAPAAIAGWISGRLVQPGAAILFAVIRAAAVAARDELLYRGIPLAAAERAGVHPLAARAFAALSGAAAIALIPGVSAAAIALALASGWLFATLWQHERSGWAAAGAHAGWALFTGSILHGGLFDADWTTGNLSIGSGSSGAPAWLATAAMVVASAILERRLRRAPEPSPEA